MAENVLETRIQLRYGTYSEWMNSRVILKQGEAAIAAFPYQKTIIMSDSSPANAPPAIGIKIGDGQHYFYELPWVQAVAADVYNWAKDSQKPTYTAQEIYGLQSYVENLISGDVEVTIAPRIYSLVQGVGTNANKYYLRYKENTEESEWIVDTSQVIDLSDLAKIVSWIGTLDLQRYETLSDRTEEHIQFHLNKLALTDSESNSEVVTSINQNNGKISITKRKLQFSDLDGVIDVTQGGTGLTSLKENEVLIGNGELPINSIPIDDAINATEHLVYNYAIKAYIDQATAGLTGAMHFIGEASVVINPNSSVDPRISGYDFSKAQAGDVILYDTKEYVWSGGNWHLLGDEGSYAVKGSIKDADIHADAEIQQSKIANLQTDLSSKVDKVEGKGLSTQDYTTEEKNKLAEIEEGAQKNLIEHLFVNGNEQIPSIFGDKNNAINLVISVFDETRAQKLDSIEYGANINKIEHIFINNIEQIPSVINGLNKSVSLNINTLTDAERIKLASIEENAQVNIIETIKVNNVSYVPNQNKEVVITLDPAALNLTVVEGAIVPNGNTTQSVPISQDKKLELARVALTGNVQDLLQTQDTYIILNCGSSTEVI